MLRWWSKYMYIETTAIKAIINNTSMTFEINFAGKGNQFPNNFQIFSIKIPRQLVTGTIVKPIK